MNAETYVGAVLDSALEAHEKVVLLVLAANSNAEGKVAMSDKDVGRKGGINARTVPRTVAALVRGGWLIPLENGGWTIAQPPRPHAHARAGTALTPTTSSGDFVSYTFANIQEGGPSQSGVTRPAPSGQRLSLGQATCELCGGTGWMEVDAGSNGHPEGNFTVDKCNCRGGPDPGLPDPPPIMRRKLEAQRIQAAVNALGLDRARKKLADGDEA